MDPATAAAMSDPARNPLFRRRWLEGDALVVPRPAPPNAPSAEDLEGLALLLAWRRERERRI